MRGTPDLPLHGGKAPPWLFKRMVALAKGICDAKAGDTEKLKALERLRRFVPEDR